MNKKTGQILAEVAVGVNDTRGMVSAYAREHPEFRDVGSLMLATWNEGLTATLSA